MLTLENGALRLRTEQGSQNDYYFVTDVHNGDSWQAASRSRCHPLEYLIPAKAEPGYWGGSGPGCHWHTVISPQASGFRLETTLHADKAVDLNPAMILWIDALDNLNDRQAHTWRQTILRAPTGNQQGLTGNDLAAGYLYDHATHVESICFFPADSFEWAPHRFYNFTLREVMSYRPVGRYGLGLVPNTPDVLFRLAPGEHRFTWWFTQRYRPEVPSPWEAQRTLLQSVAPLLDPAPAIRPEALPWSEIATHTLHDLDHEACWVTAEEHEGLRAYVPGSSAVKRDEAHGFELMTQLDVLWPLLLWQQEKHDPRAEGIIGRLQQTLPLFYRPEMNYMANNYPPRPGESLMDTWYFLENALIKLPWVAYLAGDEALQAMFFSAIQGATTLAHQTGYLFPLFADANGWHPRGSLLNAGAGGLYAAGCVIASQLGDRADEYLREAASALNVMHQLPPHQLTHEPQQLSFAAASAAFLSHIAYDPGADWAAMAEDFVRLALRMGYWGQDPAVPFYDPRGMFQACASLCYPAFKENVEVLIAWPEVLRQGLGPVDLMAAFANLQRCHNLAFFDPYLPEVVRRGPCPYIPYEDLATAEFEHTAELGKELYGTGEVFWSALLFDRLGQVDPPDILCLCLDIPCLELRPLLPADQCRCLVYNP
ncbi:MAG TPA: hypothetical protein VMT24_11440, partial [Aggregatilineaceae bacterium]|nr:hypothetical protein [Aggregatilineaceae bacterium]